MIHLVGDVVGDVVGDGGFVGDRGCAKTFSGEMAGLNFYRARGCGLILYVPWALFLEV